MANETCKECKRALVLDEENLCAYCELTQEQENGEENTFNNVNVNCGICKFVVEDDSEGLFCDVCNSWFHNNCNETPLNYDLYALLNDAPNNVKWFCDKCIWETEKWIKEMNSKHYQKSGEVENQKKIIELKEENYISIIQKDQENVITCNTNAGLKRKIGRPKGTKKAKIARDSSNTRIIKSKIRCSTKTNSQKRTSNSNVTKNEVNYSDESNNDNNESGKGCKGANESDGGGEEVNESGEVNEVIESGEGSREVYESEKGDVNSGLNINVEVVIKEEDVTDNNTFEADPEFQPGESDTDDSVKNIKLKIKNPFLKDVRRHKKESRKLEQKHQCPFCKKGRFRFHKTLVRHLKLHEEKDCVCPDCNITFKSEAKLRCHRKNVHIVKMHGCEECGKKLKSNAHLIQHMRIHTGEKPFACTLCDYRTAEKGCLKTHIARHTGEKPHLCSTCGYRALNAFLMKQHLRIHTGEKPCLCSICGKSFSSESTLRDHVMIHTGVKPYECNVCGYKCIQKGVLNRHMQTHASKPQFECTVCGFKCKVRNYLARHMLTHKDHQSIVNDFVCENSFSSIEEN